MNHVSLIDSFLKPYIMSIKHIGILSFSLLLFPALGAMSETYLVHPGISAGNGEFTYKNHTYTIGTTAFPSPSALMAADIAEGSTIYFAPGTYKEPFTVSVSGLKLMGANEFMDARAGVRYEPSKIGARITVNADNVEINGFDFYDKGQIYNDEASRAKPLTGLMVRFNVSEGNTLERKAGVAVIRLGKRYSDASANVKASRMRYADIDISHNIFIGNGAPNYIELCGASGITVIRDNKFRDGATSIHLANTVGTVNVEHNIFQEVGKSTQSSGGDFAVQINRSAGEGSSVFNIKHNEFIDCVGQESLYPVIRFYPGKAGGADLVSPVDCAVNVNYNVFTGKKKIHADYNYVYYADKSTTGNVRSDLRFNTFDNSGYSMAFVNRPGQNALQRFGSSVSGPVDPAQCTFGTFKGVTSLASVRVLQSFDVDPVTGDVFYIQLDGRGAVDGDPEPLRITRVKANGSMSSMRLVWSGHGTNMAVANIDGQQYIFTGGKAVLPSSSAEETRADACCWFRYVENATADLRENSFTHSGVTYDISSYDCPSRNNEYPAVDEVNRLFCVRNTASGVNYYRIFDLDDMLANKSKAVTLADVTIYKKSNPTTDAKDNGYNTWDHQGYTIHGDYLYVIEGVGTEASDAIDGKPTIYLHVYDWRNKKFMFRRRLNNSAIAALNSGEPEGVKLRVNDDGQAEILIGLVQGQVGSRKAVIYKYTPGSQTFAIDKASLTSATERIDLSSTTGTDATQGVIIMNSNLHGDLSVTVSGSPRFTAQATKTTVRDSRSRVVVTYTPVARVKEETGFLRVSSPTADDLIIPIKAVNNDSSGVEEIVTGVDYAPDIRIEERRLFVGGIRVMKIEIYDALSGLLICSGNEDSIDLPDSQGICILRITSETGQTYTRKISV